MSADGPPAGVVSNVRRRRCRSRRRPRCPCRTLPLSPGGPGSPCGPGRALLVPGHRRLVGAAGLRRGRLRVDDPQLPGVVPVVTSTGGDDPLAEGIAAIATAVPAPSTTTAGNASLKSRLLVMGPPLDGLPGWCLRRLGASRRLDLDAGGVEGAAAAAVGELLGRQRVGHRAARAARGPPARGQRDHAGPDDARRAAPAPTTSPRALLRRTTSPSAIPRGAASSACSSSSGSPLAGEVARQVGVGRVEEVVGALDGHERQRLGVAGRRVEAGRQAVGPQAKAPRRRPEAALGERPEVLGQIGLGPPEARAGARSRWCPAAPGHPRVPPRELLVGRVERWVVEAHRAARGGGRSRCSGSASPTGAMAGSVDRSRTCAPTRRRSKCSTCVVAGSTTSA